MFKSDTLANIRVAVFALTAGVCVVYAVLSLIMGRPDPMPWWIPWAFGIASGVILTLTSRMAGPKQAGMAWDEGYSADATRAAGTAFWVGIAMYPIFGVLLALGVVDYPIAFAVMGLLTGATYLSLIVWFDVRGRG